MSFSGGLLSTGDVEDFVYEDPSGDGPPVEASRPQADARPKEPAAGDRSPRISEQDLQGLLANARAEGIAEGERRAGAAIEETLTEERKRIADAVSAFQQERSEYYSKVEVELVHFALAIAARVLHREAQVDRMVVAGLVKITVAKLQEGSRVVVRVRPEESGSWRHYFRDSSNIQILDDASLEPRDCVLETELGTTQLGLDSQLKEIEKGFADLLAQRPEPK